MPADARLDLLPSSPARVPAGDPADWRHQPAGPKRSDYSDRLTRQLARGASHPAEPTSKAPPRPESRARGTDRPQPAPQSDARAPADEAPPSDRPTPGASEAPALDDTSAPSAPAPTNETAEDQTSSSAPPEDEPADTAEAAITEVVLTVVETAPPVPWTVEPSTPQPDPAAVAPGGADGPIEPPAPVVELLVGDASAAAQEQTAAPVETAAETPAQTPAAPPAGFASGALLIESPAAAAEVPATRSDETPSPTPAANSFAAKAPRPAVEPDTEAQTVELTEDAAPAVAQSIEIETQPAASEESSEPAPVKDQPADVTADNAAVSEVTAAAAEAPAASVAPPPPQAAAPAPVAAPSRPAEVPPADSKSADETPKPVATVSVSAERLSATKTNDGNKRPAGPIKGSSPAADPKPKDVAAPAVDPAPQAPVSADALSEVSTPATGSTESTHQASAGGQARPVETARTHHAASGSAQPGSEGDLARHAASALRAAEGLNRPIRIRLTPPELGALRVEVARDGGQVSARFEVTTAAAHSALSDHLPALRESLGRAGVAVERIEIRLAEPSREEGRSDDQRGSQHQHGQAQQGGDQRRDQGRREAPEWAQSEASRRDGEGGKPAAPEPPAPSGRRGMDADLLDIQV